VCVLLASQFSCPVVILRGGEALRGCLLRGTALAAEIRQVFVALQL
jgi:hypothetical protein